MSELATNHDHKSWQQALDPELQARLLRPMIQPGTLDHHVSNSVVNRIHGMTKGPELAADITQRWQVQEQLVGKPLPVVFAKPAATESISIAENQPAGPARPKTVVQAKKITPEEAMIQTQAPSGEGLRSRNESTPAPPDSQRIVVQAKKVLDANRPVIENPNATPILKPNQVGDNAPQNPGARPPLVVQRKRDPNAKTIKETGQQIEKGRPLGTAEQPIQRKSIASAGSLLSFVKSDFSPPETSGGTASFSEGFNQKQVVRPLSRIGDQQTDVIRIVTQNATGPGSSPTTSSPIRVQPKPKPDSISTNGTGTPTTGLPYIAEHNKSSWSTQQISSTTNGTRTSGSRTNARPFQAPPFVGKDATAILNSTGSQPELTPGRPLKSASTANGVSSKNLVQTGEKGEPARNGNFSAPSITNEDIEKIAQKVEPRLSKKIEMPFDENALLERMERNFMRKIAIEKERWGWNR